MNDQYASMSCTIKNEKQNRVSFLNVQLIHEDKLFTTSFYCKPTFSGVYTHFDRFFPSNYKFSTVYKIVYRSFRISWRWTKLHTELVCQKQIFLQIDYPENVINKSCKRFMYNIPVATETTLTIEKRSFVLVLPYFGSIPL